MIKHIEIKNFQNHAHIVADPSLRIVRKSVRVGESKCKVTVETNKGKITREKAQEIGHD